MKNLTRRDLVATLPALALFSSVFAEAQAPAAKNPTPAAENPRIVADPVAALTDGPETIPPHSRAYAYDQLPSFRNPTGAITRTVMQGTLPTGEFIEIHETTLAAGQMPHPAHRHKHSEWLMIREGTITFHTESGDTTIGPGGVTYAASGELHGVKNTGDTTALYFVFAVGKHIAM